MAVHPPGGRQRHPPRVHQPDAPGGPPPPPSHTTPCDPGRRVILVALGLLTLGGSSVFVYAAAIGEELDGLTPLTVSLLFSANALAAIPSARWTGRRGPAGLWFLMTAVCALAIACRAVVGCSGSRWSGGGSCSSWASRRLHAARRSIELPRGTRRRCPGRHGVRSGLRPAPRRCALRRRVDRDARNHGGGDHAFGAGLLLYVDRQRFVVVRQWGTWASTPP